MSAHETIDEHKRIIKLYEISEKEFIESIKPVSSGSTLDNFGSNSRQLTDVSPSGGGVTTNIGVINGNKTVDLSATSKDILYGTLTGDGIITFSNPDTITHLNLELVISTAITSLIIEGNTIDLTGYGIGDKIYLEAKTVDGTTWFLKKTIIDHPV